MRSSTSRLGRLGTLAASVAAVAALAAPSPASAIDPADVPGIGADTGRFTLPITCDISIPWLGNIKILQLPATVDIQGIAPVQLAPGQPFYLSQGRGALTLPSWLSGFATAFGVNRADAFVDTVNISATRSTPETINLADLQPLTARDIRITNQPITVGLPVEGNFDIGPYRAPADGVTQLKFTGAKATVDLKASWGLKITVRADCKAAASAGGGASLLSIAVGGAPDSTPINWQNQPLNFPKARTNWLVGIVNAPYTCSFRGEPLDVGVAVKGDIPLAIKRTQTLPVDNASGAVTIPAETVDRFIAQGHSTLSGTVTKLTLKAQGATPAEPNVIPAGGIPIPPTPLVAGQRLVIPLPATGTLRAGPFTPIAGAESIVLGLGSASADLQFDGEAEATPATCDAPSPDALLVDAAVTS